MRPIAVLAALAVAAVSLAGCAGTAWKKALQEDTAASYHRFLRENPGSKYAPAAKERLAFVRLRAKPTTDAFEKFRNDYPQSPLLADLTPIVEAQFFESARSAGTVDAYLEFVEKFPNGSQRPRAEGNAEFIRERGFGLDPAALADFAERHPESDFAAEAERSAAAVAVRTRTALRRVGLVIEIAPGTPGSDRLRRAFAERARRRYESAALELVMLRSAAGAQETGVSAVLVLRHGESEMSTELGADGLSQSGVLATTTVSLTLIGDAEPIWSDTFTYLERTPDPSSEKSVLFGAGTQSYWARFFIPVATWKTRVAVREPQQLAKPPVAVESFASRAIVLYGDGAFQMFELGDPTQPAVLAEYRRPRDLASFEGVRLTGNEVLVFGADGLEVVALTSKGPQRARAYDRGQVGSIVGAERVGTDLVVGGNRGLLILPDGAAPEAAAQRILEREIRGLARVRNRVLFTDGRSLFVSTLSLLRQGRVESELKLGRGFGPGRIHTYGTTAVVIGERGLVRLDVSNPASPRMRSRIMTDEVGAIRDATIAAGRLFLLGDRGLQVADPTGERIVDSADVTPRLRLGAMGRHVVAVGEQSLQVIDTTPFVTRAAAAP